MLVAGKVKGGWRVVAACSVLLAGPLAAQVADTLPRPALRATYRTSPVTIDGRLDEEVWRSAPVARDFVQSEPQPGMAASERTEVRVAYDHAALYVAARMYDAAPDSIARQMGRRDDDDLFADWFRLAIDSYFDRRTGFVFGVSAAGVQFDAFLFNDGSDDQLWDAVWASAVQRDSLGWTAELRIPLSQLRYELPATGATPVWGIQFVRDFARNGERDWWSPTPPSQPGIVSRFGNLTGLDSLVKRQRVEVLPYVSSQVQRDPRDAANPFWEATDTRPRVGADVRYGLPKGLTLTATINPDFGQVEVDPAVVNLTAFEVFFPERRPFFLEGVDIFRFGGTLTLNDNNPSNFFYTRRIGRRPRRNLGALGATFTDVPTQSEVLAAAKVSGKTNSGLSVGVLGAATKRETGRYADPDGVIREATVEPRTEFVVSRLRQDFRQGNTVIGGVLTGVHRELGEAALQPLFVENSLVSGVDFEHRWDDRHWAFSGFLSGSRASGDRRVVTALQRSAIRGYQRPDASHLGVDTLATSLGGYFGTLSLAKLGGTHWLGSVTYEETSPGFEVNDLGFQTRADFRSLSTGVQYREQAIGRWFRNYSMSAFGTVAANFDGDVLEKRLSTFGEGELTSFWSINGLLSVSPEVMDDRLTRGGALARKPRQWISRVGFDSDWRRAVIVEGGVGFGGSAAGAWSWSVGGGVNLRPQPSARIALRPQYSRSFNVDQYVQTVGDTLARATFGRRHVFANVEASELSVETRMEWAFSPRLTFQLWMQPFVSSGRFTAYKEFATPGRFAFAEYGRDRGTIDRRGDVLRVDPDGSGPATPFGVGVQDFTVRSLRGNAVLRWEYRLGSTLFLVWQQQREGFDGVADLSAARDLAAPFRAPASNVFLVKLAYWLGT